MDRLRLEISARAIPAQAEFGLPDANRNTIAESVQGAGRHNGPSFSISLLAGNLAGTFLKIGAVSAAAN
jgi:hypothetical protein